MVYIDYRSKIIQLIIQGLVRLLKDFPDKTADAICLFAYCKGPEHPIHVFEGKTQVFLKFKTNHIH